MYVSLKKKSDEELKGILKERRKKFDFFRMDSNNVTKKANRNIKKDKETLKKDNKTFFEVIKTNDNNKPLTLKREIKRELEISIANVTEVEKVKRLPNSNMDTTKTYNERMKVGYFGRRRVR